MKIARWAASGALIMLALEGCAVMTAPEPVEPPAPVEPAEPVPQGESPPIAVAPPQAEPVRPPPPVAEVERLLDYFRILRRLSAAELARELENARAAFLRTRSDYDRVRLALLMSVPNTPFNDEARVLELLEPMMRSPGSMLQGLAVLVHVMVYEQRRLEQNIGKLQEKLDALGETGQSYLGKLVLFYEGSGSRACHSSKGDDVSAATATGSRVVFICGANFAEGRRPKPFGPEAVIIHETLHSLGLGENPPTSDAITWKVFSRCAR